MPNRPIRVGLLWHSANSGNLGVGALTIGNMAIANGVAAELGLALDFTVIGMWDAGPSYVPRSSADVYYVNSKALILPWGVARTLGRQDCVLDIGGGDSFAEIYGFKRFVFLWWTKVLTLIQGVPLVLSPQTIGPFTRTPYRQMAAAVMTRARSVMARDQLSLTALKEMAPASKGELSVDVAFALPFEDRSAERFGKKAGGKKIRVGVNVSGLLFKEAQSGRNRFGLSVNYADLMTRFIEGLVRRPDVEVHITPHVISPNDAGDDDSRLADTLAQRFPQAVRAPDFASPSDAKSYISGLDFLVAGRMHACIAAFSSGTPVVPVAYSRKFTGLFQLLDYGWTLPVAGLETDAALAYLEECLAAREVLAGDVGKGMKKVDVLLDAYRGQLRTLLQLVAA